MLADRWMFSVITRNIYHCELIWLPQAWNSQSLWSIYVYAIFISIYVYLICFFLIYKVSVIYLYSVLSVLYPLELRTMNTFIYMSKKYLNSRRGVMFRNLVLLNHLRESSNLTGYTLLSALCHIWSTLGKLL